ncbi:MAG: hypothetical protein KKD31_19120 [Bacteroidetes bacterium]|nr:hypothetical protein [Bacteroidota bacterium]
MDIAKYRSKAKDSFNTKLTMYVFDKVIQGEEKSIASEDFVKFKIDETLKNIYTAKYWQWDVSAKLKEICTQINSPVKTDLTIRDIYDEMKSLRERHKSDFKEFEAKYIANFSEFFPEEEFQKLLEKECCHYCGITLQTIEDLTKAGKIFKKQLTRGWTFEIDRKDSNFEYTPDNTVACCYWCNNAKTDEFTEEEFLRVGEVLGKIWKRRLGR